LILDAETGMVVDVNPFLVELLGYSRDVLLGKKLWELGSFKDIVANQAHFAELQQKEYIRYEDKPLETSDGRRIEVEFVSYVYQVNHQRVIQCNIRDITQRKRADESLSASEVRYRRLFETAKDGILVLDAETGMVVDVNPFLVELLGYSRDVFLGKKVWELGSFKDIVANQAHFTKLQQKGYVRYEDRPLETSDGRRVEVEFVSNVYLVNHHKVIQCNIRDITERKRTEEQLKASFKEISDLKAALDEHAIVATTDAQGKITYVNDKFCTISRYSREELLGQDHRILNSGHHPKEFIRNLWTTITDGRVWHGEIKNRAKDGSYYWVDATIVPFLNEQGKPRQYVAIRTDITARKHAEEQVRELNTKLEQRVVARTAELAAVNKELEAFCYSVSHDLRAPLRGLDGFSQALLEDYGDKLGDDGQHLLQRIRAGSQRMGQLIDDLLNLSRVSRSELRREPVNLSSLAGDIVEELRSHDPHRDVALRIADNLTADGDPQFLRVVLENLLGNAWKYTAKQPHATIEFGLDCDNGQPSFFVRDDGVGFDMQYVDKLFTPFQRLHAVNEFPGTGIGLATVQRIVHRHGGRVWAEAEVNKGATFHFTLP
jgi:PAS domain S-box-containing protein